VRNSESELDFRAGKVGYWKMKNKIMKFVPLLLLLASLEGYCFEVAQNTEAVSAPANTSSKLVGRWSADCSSQGLKIDKSLRATFEINSNQIYIDTRLKFIGNNIANIYLSRPTDLGSGGRSLDWSHFSKSAPIAAVKISDSDGMTLTWNGFYNEKTKSYQWTTDPDFYEKSNRIHFQKCKD